MYFELVLAYPATCINDISLMNLSALTSRRPVYVALVYFSWESLHVLSLLLYSSVSILFVKLPDIRQAAFVFPVFVGTAKVENFFILSSFFFFFYFPKAKTFFKSLRKLNHFLLYNLQILHSISPALFPFLRSGMQK